LGIRVALLPLHLLWLNLLTDGLMGLGLGLEPAEAGTMRRSPRSPKASLLDSGARRHILWVGVAIGVLTLGVGAFYYTPENQTWQTMMFATLAFTQIGHALGLRAAGKTIWQSLRANPALMGLTGLTIVLQIAVIFIPFLDTFFEVVPLSAFDFGLSVLLGGIIWAAVEIEKRLINK